MEAMLGPASPDFFRALEDSAPVSIRANKHKITPIEGSPVPWCDNGHYLSNRPVFTLDPFFHQGSYYVQEASSMFLEQLIRQNISDQRPLRVLDCCAAPGGKSTHLLDLLPAGSLLVANEVIRSRVPMLVHNLVKWGCSSVAVTSSDPENFSNLTGIFDIILIDAPCSGEGMFRKDPAAAIHWSPENVTLCASRQQRILESVWPALRENGLLIYSTCTWNSAEDEENLAWLRANRTCEPVTLKTNPDWGVEEINFQGATGYKFFPHRLSGEGFFTGALRKTSAENEVPLRMPRKPTAVSSRGHVENLLIEPGKFHLRMAGETICADPAEHLSLIEKLKEQVNVIRCGISIGRWAGQRFIPEHDFALSVDRNPDAFPSTSLSTEDAIRYLRKDAVQADGSGITLLTHGGLGMGWGNFLPGRMNNLLPTNWRIRMNAG